MIYLIIVVEPIEFMYINNPPNIRNHILPKDRGWGNE